MGKLSGEATQPFLFCLGAPVAQWVKRWPTDLEIPSSSHTRGKMFSTINGVPLHTAFHPGMTEILLKRT